MLKHVTNLQIQTTFITEIALNDNFACLAFIAIPKETQEWLLLLQVAIAHQMMSHQLRFAENYGSS